MKTILNRCLDSLGDGTGTKNAKVDGSVTPQDFFIQPSSDQVLILENLMVVVEDTGAMGAPNYGNVSTLSNGVGLYLSLPGEVDILGGLTIKRHYDWARLSGDNIVDSNPLGGVGSNIFVAHINFRKLFSEPLVLSGKGSNPDKLIARISDDLTDLDGHYFFASGFIGAA